jgi:hypothetical protein
MAHEHLSIYLNDHLAGSVVALELLEHLEKEHAGTDVGRSAAALRADILADRKELEALMERLHVPKSAPRRAMAWLSEKATEVKLRIDDPAGGAFRLLEVMDVISVGVEGKRLLWRSLAASGVAAPPGADYRALERRAEEQRERVEAVRLKAAKAALGDS